MGAYRGALEFQYGAAMTRRMPVLPIIECNGCPALVEPGRGDARTCRVQLCIVASGAPNPEIFRLHGCISDELAWRNVCAGLAMVAAYTRGYGHGRRHDQ